MSNALGYDCLFPVMRMLNRYRVLGGLPTREQISPASNPSMKFAYELIDSFVCFDRKTEKITLSESSDPNAVWFRQPLIEYCHRPQGHSSKGWADMIVDATELEPRMILLFPEEKETKPSRFLYGIELNWGALRTYIESLIYKEGLLPVALDAGVEKEISHRRQHCY